MYGRLVQYLCRKNVLIKSMNQNTISAYSGRLRLSLSANLSDERRPGDRSDVGLEAKLVHGVGQPKGMELLQSCQILSLHDIVPAFQM